MSIHFVKFSEVKNFFTDEITTESGFVIKQHDLGSIFAIYRHGYLKQKTKNCRIIETLKSWLKDDFKLRSAINSDPETVVFVIFISPIVQPSVWSIPIDINPSQLDFVSFQLGDGKTEIVQRAREINRIFQNPKLLKILEKREPEVEFLKQRQYDNWVHMSDKMKKWFIDIENRINAELVLEYESEMPDGSDSL